MEFEKSFKIGRKGENYVIDLLDKAGIKCQINPNKTKVELTCWDIEAEIQKHKFYIEVKYDVKSAKTGNLAVEYYNVKICKPSGLYGTTADLWVYVLSKKEIYVCRTDKLREYFESEKCLRDVPCGGNDNSAMKLYKKDELLSIFHRIDGLPPSELKRLLYELCTA